MLQNKAAHIVLDLPPRTSFATPKQNYIGNHYNVLHRRAEHSATFVYELINNLFSCACQFCFNHDFHA